MEFRNSTAQALQSNFNIKLLETEASYDDGEYLYNKNFSPDEKPSSNLFKVSSQSIQRLNSRIYSETSDFTLTP